MRGESCYYHLGDLKLWAVKHTIGGFEVKIDQVIHSSIDKTLTRAEKLKKKPKKTKKLNFHIILFKEEIIFQCHCFEIWIISSFFFNILFCNYILKKKKKKKNFLFIHIFFVYMCVCVCGCCSVLFIFSQRK